MTIESLPIADLLPDPANARSHDPRNIAAIKGSLARFGQQKPIVIDAAGVLRCGNGTLTAARELGWTHINVVRSNLIGAEATAYAIADNRSAELAAWDDEILAGVLSDPNIGEVGFDEKEIEALLVANTPPDDDPQMETELGEMFQVIIECSGEAQQKQVFDRMTEEGFTCRLLTL